MTFRHSTRTCSIIVPFELCEEVFSVRHDPKDLGSKRPFEARLAANPQDYKAKILLCRLPGVGCGTTCPVPSGCDYRTEYLFENTQVAQNDTVKRWSSKRALDFIQVLGEHIRECGSERAALRFPFSERSKVDSTS